MLCTEQTYTDDPSTDWREFTHRDARMDAIAADLHRVLTEVPNGVRW